MLAPCRCNPDALADDPFWRSKKNAVRRAVLKVNGVPVASALFICCPRCKSLVRAD